MLDRSFIGLESPPQSVAVEAGQLRFFAQATGEINPIYFDEDRAQAAGHRAILAPPTYLFCLGSLAPVGMSTMARLGLDMGRVLHGEQSFTHREAIYAGDVITLKARISDIYDKRDGALDFIVEDTQATNQDGVVVGVARTVIVVRNR
jgi:acyl dehydratase